MREGGREHVCVMVNVLTYLYRMLWYVSYVMVQVTSFSVAMTERPLAAVPLVFVLQVDPDGHQPAGPLRQAHWRRADCLRRDSLPRGLHLGLQGGGGSGVDSEVQGELQGGEGVVGDIPHYVLFWCLLYQSHMCTHTYAHTCTCTHTPHSL